MAGMRRGWIYIGWLVLLMFGCQSPRAALTSAWLAADNPAWIHFPLQSDSQSYAFSASADAATVLTFASLTPDLAYTAEIRNGRGLLIATLTSGLPNAELTIKPGSEVYEVTVKPGSSASAGALALTTSSRQPAPPAAANFDPGTSAAATSSPLQTTALVAPASPICQTASATTHVNIRSGPGLEHAVIGTLLRGTGIDADGRSAGGWYRVHSGGVVGWVSGSVVALSGDCETLPLVAPETEPFPVMVDRSTWGSFSDSVAADDPHDLLQVIVTNFLPQPPDNYGEFTLTMTCDGPGKEYVRWGSPDMQTFPCDSAIILPFINGSERQTFAVTLTAAVTQPIRYNLAVTRR